jgi:fructose-specific component phosphotransferase system IIB-like protein
MRLGKKIRMEIGRMQTIVYQSHSPDKLKPWMELTVASVKEWAQMAGYDYRFIGNELFEAVPQPLRAKYSSQPVVLSDLARLRLLQAAISQGYERAIWMDADMLVFAPEALHIPAERHLVGREVWVQRQHEALKTYKKVHNAFMAFTADDSFLPFYADCAEDFLDRAEAPVVPQFIGPKFLTAQHNLIELNVLESAGMLSPLCLADVLKGGGAALELMKGAHKGKLAAVNMSASYEGREADGVCNREQDYEQAVQILLKGGTL